jgi:predicted nucleotidyltransferase
MAGTVIQDSLLPEIVRRIVEAVDPDKIILFGSRARGDNRPDSDFDLLVIKPSQEAKHRRAVPILRSLWGMDAPIDVVWYTPEEFEDWSGIRTHLVGRVLREGRVLHEKTH